MAKYDERVVLEPHLGASTLESNTRAAVQAAKQCVEYLKNGVVLNAVNNPKLDLRE